jgi:hypothetical protein
LTLILTIGKTVFLSYVLIERLLTGLPTVYQTSKSMTFVFLGPDDVRIYPQSTYLDPEKYPDAWALVDSNEDMIVPRPELTDSNSKYYVIQASSPQPKRWKEWKKKLSASLIVMEAWTWEEMYIGGSVHWIEIVSLPFIYKFSGQ